MVDELVASFKSLFFSLTLHPSAAEEGAGWKRGREGCGRGRRLAFCQVFHGHVTNQVMLVLEKLSTHVGLFVGNKRRKKVRRTMRMVVCGLKNRGLGTLLLLL